MKSLDRGRVGVLLLLLLVPQSAWAQGARFWDETALRSRTRIGLLWDLRSSRQLRLAYQFQYTQDRTGVWGPQHAIVVRYWFGERLSWRAVN